MTTARVSALVSGGKDSLYSAYLAETQGWPVDELVTLEPEDPDSPLFHTPNLGLVALQAEAWGKRHRAVRVDGRGEDAETAALERALESAAPVVSAGAIASSYQWARLHRVCYRLGRRLFAPLWGKDGARVVREEIAAGLDIRLVHLAAEPLTPELLGRRLDDATLDEILRRSRTRRGVHAAGEGGEYETLVADAPFWRARLVWGRAESLLRSGGVATLAIRQARLAAKSKRTWPTPSL
jgi:diphthine-ammonia ligase